MKYEQKSTRKSELASLLCLSIATAVFSVNVAGEIFDMDATRDPKTLGVKVLQDWHTVQGQVTTR
jgi:hypothetical protein